MQRSHGARLFVRNTAGLSAHELLARRQVANGQLGLVRRAIRENARLKKDPHKRKLVGPEEILLLQRALWASENPRCARVCVRACVCVCVNQ